MPNIIMADEPHGEISFENLEIYIADFVVSPPVITRGALDGWNRTVVA